MNSPASKLTTRRGPQTTRMSSDDEEIGALEASFAGISEQFRILEKVGEGTFSCVYRAIDLQRDKWDQSWEKESVPGQQGVVALKRIHVTSSPTRIANELEILATLSRSRYVSHVITAMRCRDQVLVVMPYIPFMDFRHFYRNASMHEIRMYMSQLLEGLAFVHSKQVIHRDVKPTNFLWNRDTGVGVLVDFGLAEMEEQAADGGGCICRSGGYVPSQGFVPKQGGYHKDDARHSRRANRAGTRGFRAPEVLVKCTSQTTKIDIWAAGVVLLMLLTRRFPFFNSMDDSEAMVELATLFGRLRMQRTALQHGAAFETTIPSIREHGWALEDVVDFCRERDMEAGLDHGFTEVDDRLAMDLLKHMLEPDYRRRPTADKALKHPFFAS